jgi:hypothetical protein
MDNTTALLLAVVAIATAAYLQFSKNELSERLTSCQIQYQGFKDGVMYGK